MRVLLVEDDTMIGESLREALRRQAMACDWVRDGRAAARKVAPAPHFRWRISRSTPPPAR